MDWTQRLAARQDVMKVHMQAARCNDVELKGGIWTHPQSATIGERR